MISLIVVYMHSIFCGTVAVPSGEPIHYRGGLGSYPVIAFSGFVVHMQEPSIIICCRAAGGLGCCVVNTKTQISFVHNIRFNCPIGLKFCTEHGSNTAVLCATFQSDRWTGAWVMGKRDFASFESKMNFGRISYNAQGPRRPKLIRIREYV